MVSIKETKYVHEVYDKLANEFDKTRLYIWPSVKKFLDGLDKDDICLDVGCGNGRNMMYRTDLNMFGLDYSKNLCEICIDKGLNVVNGNCIELPFTDNSIDNCISIAVIHHLDTSEKRLQAIKEMIRVTKPNGKIFIQVWAVEQPTNSKRIFQHGDNIVEWKGKTNQSQNRYYYIYKSTELKDICKELNIKILEYFNEAGNWCIIMTKV
jgi:ubiquinone/menaquinone biosynthesis C-methylase UbiE